MSTPQLGSSKEIFKIVNATKGTYANITFLLIKDRMVAMLSNNWNGVVSIPKRDLFIPSRPAQSLEEKVVTPVFLIRLYADVNKSSSYRYYTNLDVTYF